MRALVSARHALRAATPPTGFAVAQRSSHVPGPPVPRRNAAVLLPRFLASPLGARQPRPDFAHRYFVSASADNSPGLAHTLLAARTRGRGVCVRFRAERGC